MARSLLISYKAAGAARLPPAGLRVAWVSGTYKLGLHAPGGPRPRVNQNHRARFDGRRVYSEPYLQKRASLLH